MLEPGPFEDHCWLRAMGADVRIVEMRGLREIRCVTNRGIRWVLDLSDVDWAAYNAKAVEYMRWQFGL